MLAFAGPTLPPRARNRASSAAMPAFASLDQRPRRGVAQVIEVSAARMIHDLGSPRRTTQKRAELRQQPLVVQQLRLAGRQHRHEVDVILRLRLLRRPIAELVRAPLLLDPGTRERIAHHLAHVPAPRLGSQLARHLLRIERRDMLAQAIKVRRPVQPTVRNRQGVTVVPPGRGIDKAVIPHARPRLVLAVPRRHRRSQQRRAEQRLQIIAELREILGLRPPAVALQRRLDRALRDVRVHGPRSRLPHQRRIRIVRAVPTLIGVPRGAGARPWRGDAEQPRARNGDHPRSDRVQHVVGVAARGLAINPPRQLVGDAIRDGGAADGRRVAGRDLNRHQRRRTLDLQRVQRGPRHHRRRQLAPRQQALDPVEDHLGLPPIGRHAQHDAALARRA